MAGKESAHAAPAAPVSSDKLYMENTLLRVTGALFCHDPKRARARTDEIALNSGVPDKAIVIRPDPKLGQPGQLAHKVFVALLKKHSDYGRPIQREVSFTRREIGRLIGRSSWGGRESEQLARALYEIHYTFVRTQFRKKDGRLAEHSFSVFPEIYFERREFASDPIEACTVTLAEPVIASLNDEHFTCLNHRLMQELGTIGQALYMRLFFHFANLHEEHARTKLRVTKRYDHICSEWLGGLSVLTKRSDIIRDQVGKHLDQLIAAKFLSGYSLDKAKSGSGFVMTFRPGQTFFDDYNRFYRRRQQGEMQFEFRADQATVGEPLRVAYLFAEKRTGQPPGSMSFAPSKDVETAKQLLRTIPFEEVGRFLDFALSEAARTNFAVQTLGGLMQYVAPYQARRGHQEAAERIEAARQAQEPDDRLQAYDAYRVRQGAAVLVTLPLADQIAIEGDADAFARKFPASLQERMRAFRIATAVAERHPNAILTLEQWRETGLDQS